MCVTGIVVQNDLIDALKNGTIFGAGLDVMVPEPLPKDDILTKLPNCGEFFFCFVRLFFQCLVHFILLFWFFSIAFTLYSAHPTFGISCCSNPRRYGQCCCSKYFKHTRWKATDLRGLLTFDFLSEAFFRIFL